MKEKRRNGGECKETWPAAAQPQNCVIVMETQEVANGDEIRPRP